MWIGRGFLLSLALVGLAAGCNRNAVEAVNKAIEGDKSRDVNVDDAISKYQEAAILDPNNHRILWKLATAYQKKEDWANVAATSVKAQQASERAYAKKKTFAEYYWLQGYATMQLVAKGQATWADAKTPLTTAIEIDGNLAKAHYNLGKVLLHMDDEQGALKEYSKAIELKPDEIRYYAALINLYRNLDFLDLAEQVAKEGLSFAPDGDPRRWELYSSIGDIAQMKKDAKGAVSAYESARKACGECNAEPEQREVFFNLGYAYFVDGRKSEAHQNMLKFHKLAGCKSGGQKHFQEQCLQADEVIRKVGGQGR